MHSKWWSILFGVVLGLEGIAVLVSPLFGVWLPKNVASFGGGVDLLFYVILAVTGFFYVLTEAILVYNMYRASVAPATEKAPYIHGNHKLELLWSIVPGAILLLLAVAQINVWADIKYQSHMPNNDPDFKKVEQIEVVARQWDWMMRYPNVARMDRWYNDKSDDYREFGLSESLSEVDHHYPRDRQLDDIYLPGEVHAIKDTKVLIHLRTRDVLHSFFLPHLRLKQDALPGKIIPVWFQVTESNTRKEEETTKIDPSQPTPKPPKTGHWYLVRDAQGRPDQSGDKYHWVRWVDGVDGAGKEDKAYVWDLVCAEYCGTRHSMMRGKLFVHTDRDDFLNWLKTVESDQRPPR